MDGWMDGWREGGMDGWMEGGRDGGKDGWMEGMIYRESASIVPENSLPCNSRISSRCRDAAGLRP